MYIESWKAASDKCRLRLSLVEVPAKACVDMLATCVHRHHQLRRGRPLACHLLRRVCVTLSEEKTVPSTCEAATMPAISS
jgi:hypothetical protein